MTILPGHPVAPPPEAPEPKPPKPPKRSKRSSQRGIAVSRRTLAAVAAGVVVAGGGGAWVVLHSSGASHPVAAASPQQPVHHPAAPVRLPAPRTAAEALHVANRIFAVVPAQLPGWKVTGKATIDRSSSSGSDPVARSVARCVAGSQVRGVAVNSPDVSRSTAEPTEMSVSTELTFVRTPAVAAADLAMIRSARTQRCITAAVVGRTVSLGHGATLRFTSARPLRLPSR